MNPGEHSAFRLRCRYLNAVIARGERKLLHRQRNNMYSGRNLETFAPKPLRGTKGDRVAPGGRNPPFQVERECLCYATPKVHPYVCLRQLILTELAQLGG